jgi:hypothetical protein
MSICWARAGVPTSNSAINITYSFHPRRMLFVTVVRSRGADRTSRR